MSKEQFIKKGKFETGHTTNSGLKCGGSNTNFKLSANEDGNVTILATYNEGKSHIEIEHELMDCSVKYLIKWLQAQVEKLGKWAE